MLKDLTLILALSMLLTCFMSNAIAEDCSSTDFIAIGHCIKSRTMYAYFWNTSNKNLYLSTYKKSNGTKMISCQQTDHHYGTSGQACSFAKEDLCVKPHTSHTTTPHLDPHPPTWSDSIHCAN